MVIFYNRRLLRDVESSIFVALDFSFSIVKVIPNLFMALVLVRQRQPWHAWFQNSRNLGFDKCHSFPLKLFFPYSEKIEID